MTLRKSQDRSDPQNPTDPQGQTPLTSYHDSPVHCGSVALLNSNIQPLPQECRGSNVPRAPSNPPSNLSGDFQCVGSPGPKWGGGFPPPSFILLPNHVTTLLLISNHC